MTLENEKKLSLNKILEELSDEIFYDVDTLYGRFKTIMSYITDDIKQFKSGQSYEFFEDEKPFIKGLIIEMGEPYLANAFKLSKGKKSKDKSLKIDFEEANAFRDRMLKRIESVQNQELKEAAIRAIDFLSKKRIKELAVEQEKKMKRIADLIMNQNLNDEEYVSIYLEINDGLDAYYETLIQRFKNNIDNETKG